MGRTMARAAAEAVGGGILILAAYAALVRIGGSLPLNAKVLLTLAALAVFVVRRRFPEAALVLMGALLGTMSAFAPLAAVTAYTVTRQLAGSGRRAAALRERTAAAEEARRLADSEARTHERSRIAAEMHDLVGHRLSLISLHTGGLEMALRGQPQDLRDSAAQIRQTTRDAMRELREVLGVLGPLARDTGTDALTDATGTRADIEALVAESRAGGVAVEVAVAHTADVVEVSVVNGAGAVAPTPLVRVPAPGADAPEAGAARPARTGPGAGARTGAPGMGRDGAGARTGGTPGAGAAADGFAARIAGVAADRATLSLAGV
ncbi:sensor histidine kinase [Streptomyces sp. NBC_00536]|uniref:sensor histidine kinase n=1 Tax=Streptomyces sp. NBC_00536 TaxID=2975769 RepID=UPI002E7FEFCF|nr:histidine kinase dimerization/phosphoacceptor domain-containing protein [Streptomyces sp. NBC_00536]